MNYQQIKEQVFKKFQEHNALDRYYHMEEVVKMALYLNEHFNFQVDEEKIKVAGITHDYTKILNMEESRKLLEKKMSRNEIEELFKAPAVVHGYTAYYLIQDQLDITDEDICNAVKNHTTGRPNMTILEKLIFVSDAIELTRTYPGVEKIREQVLKDFDQGMLFMIETTLNHLCEKGYYINPLTIETYNYYRREYANK